MAEGDFPPVKLVGDEQREQAKRYIDQAPEGYMVRVGEPTRTLEQNAKMWPMLTDLSKQVIWHGFKLSTDDWKDFGTAVLKKQKIVPNLDGDGFIAVGGSTKDMSKSKFSDLIEVLYMIGAREDVVWSEKAQKVIDEYGQEWEAK